jgi:serine/threonine-protein kinase
MLIDLKAAAGASYTEKMKDEMQLTQEELEQISKKTGDKYKDYDDDDGVSKRNKNRTSSDDIPENKIKERNTVIAAIITGLLLVVVLTGLGAWFIHNQDQNTIKVPNFIGLDVTAAEKLAESKGITIEENEDYSDEYDKDTVFYQSVRKGKRIDKSETIVLKISKGKNVIDMPNLLDLSLSEAIEVIKSSGLILADTQYVASDKEIGTVVSQSINAGVKVAPDTEITISVSEGTSTKSIPVPDVENMEVSKAKELLEDNNLIVSIEESFSSTIDDGNVITQSIEGGTEVTEGTEIVLTVSKGVDPEEESELVSIQEANEDNVGKHVESEGEETSNEPVTEAQQQKSPKSVSISVNPDINNFTPNDNGEYNVKITAKNAEGEKTVVDKSYSAGDFPFSVNDTILDSTNYEITINGQHYNSQSAEN